ncbi:hypothetical protein [Aquimarina agarilytica]|uniref:hypothetical protein n=1 Tax=Aquimarina agarilytica TaxID=1087449 RepID=UPI0002898DA3|nr:hypothetical protein [Aquimarina agarilytica]
MTKPHIKTIAISSGIMVIAGLGFLQWRKQHRANKASLIYNELQQILDGTYALQWEEAFDVEFINKIKRESNKTIQVLKPEVALQYAVKIKSAWGAWYQGGDDEAKVYSVFRALSDKVQISQVAKAYQDEYGKHLIEVIKNRFSEREIKVLLTIIKQKPTSSYA